MRGTDAMGAPESARAGAAAGRESALAAIRADLRAKVDADLARARYRDLAEGYDGTCRRIQSIRAAAVAALDLRPGQHVADIACGTGATLPALAHAVGVQGRVTGFELSPEMAAIASARIEAAGLTGRVRIIIGPVENMDAAEQFDAFLFCYTHDVLQSPQSLSALAAAARPGARIAVAGARFLPWWWGFGINLFTAYRARHYLTSYRGLGQPWRGLLDYVPGFHIIGTEHFGTSYLGTGTFVPQPKQSNLRKPSK